MQKLPKKKFFEKQNSSSKNNNSMYVLNAEDLGKEFLNDGLKISPRCGQDAQNINEPSNMSLHESGSKKNRFVAIGKAYESDRNNNSIDEADSFDENDN